MGSYKGLFAVDIKSGEPLWLYDWEKSFNSAGDHITDPVVLGSKVFITQFYEFALGSALMDVSGAAPNLVWKNQENYSETASPILLDGALYLCNAGIYSGSGSLRRIDPATGSLVWEEKLNGTPISLTAPVLCGGRLYCRNFSGILVCIDVRP